MGTSQSGRCHAPIKPRRSVLVSPDVAVLLKSQPESGRRKESQTPGDQEPTTATSGNLTLDTDGMLAPDPLLLCAGAVGHTVAMIAADIWRRVGIRRHANGALREKSDLPRVLVISHRWELNGGAEFGFRDMILALRKKRPDLDLVGVYPRKGSLATECAGYGIRTEIAWVP